MSDLGNKEIMSRNLKRQMLLYNKTRQDLCNDLGFKYTTVSDWINGKVYPRIDKIEMLARYFGVSKSDLVERNGEVQPSHNARRVIPIYGRIAAGKPLEMVDDIIGEVDISYYKMDGEFFALKIKGRSMEPRLEDGDIIVVRQQPMVENGEIAAVSVGMDDATCKKVYSYPTGIRLVPINPEYEPIILTNEDMEKTPVRILGKVVEVRHLF